MRKFASVTLLAILLNTAGLFGVGPAVAQSIPTPVFDMNMVVADDQFVDYLGMSVSRIQEFLNIKSGVLKSYIGPDGRSAAQTIYDAAQDNHISPRVILTIIQKESSMITRSSFAASCTVKTSQGTSWPCKSSKEYFLEWATFAGWCEDSASCYYGSPYLEKYRGFANQINWTAGLFRYYLDNVAAGGRTLHGNSYYGPGPNIPMLFTDCVATGSNGSCTSYQNYTVTPANAATAALYTYTPHKASAYSFWSRWNDFGFNFRRVYPDGTLLQAQGSKSVYLLQDGLKRKFSNMSAFLSRYSSNRILPVPADVLTQYDNGKPIAFANYSVVSAPNKGVYLLVDDTKRPIKSKKAFQAAGFTSEEVIKASWADLNQFTDGVPITTENVYPSGILMQHSKTGVIYFVKDNVRYPVISKDIFKSQFGSQRPVKTAGSKLATYPIGSPIGFKDGDLVQSRTSTTVYFISHGYRLPIASSQAAHAYGFNKIWKSRIITDDKSIAVHPIGQTLDVDTAVVAMASQ